MPIRILHLEDNDNDAELVRELIGKDGIDATWTRVAGRDDFASAIQHKSFDLILCDYNLPSFDGLSALVLAKGVQPQTPFIYVSGAIGEERATESLKRGATDYILKDRISRLPAAVRRAMQQAEDQVRRTQAEEALRESEYRLRSIIDNEPECVKLVSPDGLLLQINPAGLAMLEAESPDSVLGKSVYPLIMPEHRRAFEELTARVCAGQKGELEFEIVGLKGTRRWIDTHAAPLRNNDGDIVAVLSIARDITTRKQAEKLQNAVYRIAQAATLSQHLNELFRGVHEIIKEVMVAENFYIALYDETGGVLSFPYFVDEVDVVSPPQKPGKGLTEYVLRTGKSLLCDARTHEELIRRGEADLVGAPSSIWLGVPLSIETKTIGVMVVQHYTDSAVYGNREKEMLEYVSTQIAKVIERKRSEAQLRQSEEQFRLITENMADLVAVLDLDGRRLYNSPSYRPLLGDPTSLEGTDSFEEIHPEDRPRIRKVFQETLKAGIGQRTEYRMITKDGAVRFIESQGSIINDERGEPARVVIVSRDITERKELEEQFRQAQKMESVGTLAGGVAHDFNNILGIIIGYIGSLQGREATHERIETSLVAISKAAWRGSDLVKKLMTFARKSEATFIPVHVNQVIEELASMLTVTFPKSIEFEFNLSRTIPKIVADPTQLNQALLNLCLNARDAMATTGRLTISTERFDSEAIRAMFPSAENSPHVVIRVKDTGTGMENEVRERIFEPFYTTKEPGKGTGLGLAVVYGVVRGHNGFVTVDSAPSEGTTFNLFLPLGLDRLGKPEETAGIQEPIHGGPETILLVEDEDLLADLIESLLTTNGYTVLVARTGREAIEIYRNRHEDIHLVVSDLGLPEMLGNEAYIRMREINPRVRAIFATGYLDSVEKDDLLQMGAIAIIQKPFIPNQILKAVRAALDNAS